MPLVPLPPLLVNAVDAAAAAGTAGLDEAAAPVMSGDGDAISGEDSVSAAAAGPDRVRVVIADGERECGFLSVFPAAAPAAAEVMPAGGMPDTAVAAFACALAVREEASDCQVPLVVNVSVGIRNLYTRELKRCRFQAARTAICTAKYNILFRDLPGVVASSLDDYPAFCC